MTVILIVISTLWTFLRGFERELEIRGRIETIQNTALSQNIKSPGDLERLSVTQTPMKDHQLMLVWKTFDNNNNNNNNKTKTLPNPRSKFHPSKDNHRTEWPESRRKKEKKKKNYCIICLFFKRQNDLLIFTVLQLFYRIELLASNFMFGFLYEAREETYLLDQSV